MRRGFIGPWCSLLLVSAFSSCMPTYADSLLTPAYEAQLEAWLGEGDLNFVSVYDSDVDGFTAAAFHANADLVGRTFSLIEVLPTRGNENQVIGGYNPQSWDMSINGWNYSVNLEDRTAFVFNLDTGVIHRQGTDYLGSLQTWNTPYAGPEFGEDIFMRIDHGWYAVDNDFYSIGSGSLLGSGFTYFDPGRIQTFTIENVSVVPEPSSMVSLGIGLSLLGVIQRMRAKRQRQRLGSETITANELDG